MSIKSYFFITGCLLSFALTFCKSGHEDHHGPGIQGYGYRIVDISKFGDCLISAYIIDKRGKYAFRFALSGRCTALTKELYLEQYTNFLEKYADSLAFKKGQRMQLDFYKERGIDRDAIEKIAKVTTCLAKKQVEVININEDFARLEVR